jgi:hypothetical protein
MKFGKLFTKLMSKYPQFTTLSANRFSHLTYTELKAIAKAMRANGDLYGNYTHDNHSNLANRVYRAVVEM